VQAILSQLELAPNPITATPARPAQ